MSGRILIIDTVATNRIVQKVKMLAAQYDAVTCANLAEARAAMVTERPDLIMINLSDRAEDNHAFCRDLKDDPQSCQIAIIATGVADTCRARFAALDAGVDDVMPNPVNDTLLMARIRSLLRMRHAHMELWMRDGTSSALGFDEKAKPFRGQHQIGILGVAGASDHAIKHRFAQIDNIKITSASEPYLLEVAMGTALPDVVVIDCTTLQDPQKDLFRIVADLRSRASTRLAAQLVVVPTDGLDMAAMALDLGADDVVHSHVSTGELALRCAALITRKALQDKMRNTVRDGLQAAVTDPLTGLYNRRYATPYLASVAEQSIKTGNAFAVMMLDIDYFKSVNDTYGHAAGDAVLIELANRLRTNLRAIDLVARIGGEEFLIAVPHTSPEQAEVAADRLRRLVNEKAFYISPDCPALRVTISVGVAVSQPAQINGMCTDAMCKQADVALYEAKSSGRDAVSVAYSVA